MKSHQKYISFVIYNKLIRLFYIALCKFKYFQIIINKLMTLICGIMNHLLQSKEYLHHQSHEVDFHEKSK